MAKEIKTDALEFSGLQQEKIELLYMELDKIRAELIDEKRNMTELRSSLAKEKAHTNELEKALSSAHQEYQEELDTLQKNYQDSINNLQIPVSSSKGKSQLSDLVTTLQNQIHTLSKENEELRLKLSEHREMLRKTRATLSANEGENRRLSESFSVGEDLLELNKSLTLQFESFTEKQTRLKLEKEEFIHQIATQKNQYENELVTLENQLSSEKKK
jgi:FtsZ-binding cell division protein ZapB